jgi:hypothetical protein
VNFLYAVIDDCKIKDSSRNAALILGAVNESIYGTAENLLAGAAKAFVYMNGLTG